MYAHEKCPDCPDLDDVARRMAEAADVPSLLRHGCMFVLVLADANETVVKSSPNLPREKVAGVLRVAAQVARGETAKARSGN